jgi:acetoacetyl-CoA synthetase
MHGQDEAIFSPEPAAIARSQLTAFIGYCQSETGRTFKNYDAFYSFSVAEFPLFWGLFLRWSGLSVEGELEPACTGNLCETAQLFPRLRLNYAEALIGGRQLDDSPALTSIAQSGRRHRLTRRALRQRVLRLASALRRLGVRPGDRVVAVARNSSESVVAALATTAIGAVFSSCAPEMGSFAILSRFAQLDPVEMMAHVSPAPHDTADAIGQRIAEIAAALPSLAAVIALDDGAVPSCATKLHRLSDLVASGRRGELDRWQRFPFDHPLFVMFSSGTTGQPKCIVHGAGGTLIEHLKEHRLHCDLRRGDKLFFHTSCAWMMWQWQLSALASGAEIVLFDGPLQGPETLWRIVAEERVTVFGTSPAYLQYCEQAGFVPQAAYDLSSLRSILSTGSILYDRQFNWVSDTVSAVLPLQSISGGTDIIGCFVLGNPNLPVHRGEAQCRSLGLDVRALPADDAPGEPIGELVCANPFPSRPLGFFGDADGSRFHAAYFSQHPGFWTHGDLIEFGRSGGARLHGRSDGVLNIRGIRVGPAEIYRILQDVPEIVEAIAVEQRRDDEPGGTRLVLLVVLHEGINLEGRLVARIRRELATRGSVVLVPAVVIQVDELPITHNGKRSETAARDAVNGRSASNRAALRNPACLEAIGRHRALADVVDAAPCASGSIEQQLQAIWERLFGFAPVDIDDNFFEIGGHSLLAMRIMAELRAMTDRDLPLSTLLHAPTIRRLAALLRTTAWSPFSSMVPLRGGLDPPLFLVHGIGGNVLDLRGLAVALRTRRSIFALQARGLDPSQEPHDSIEAMARDYVAQVRLVQPCGPYAIVGFSFGGLVAFEMAQCLRASGEEVELLGLIDTDVHERALPLPAWVRFQWDRLWRHGRAWRALPKWQRLAFLRQRLEGIADRVRVRLGHAPHKRWADELWLPPLLQRVRDAAKIAFANYRPRRYDGKVVLFRSAERLDWFCDPLPVWQRVAPTRLEVVVLPADHRGLIEEPAVRLLAEALDGYLESLRSTERLSSDTSSPRAA